jgi:hypothetical protein
MTTKQQLTAHELACAAKYILDNVTDDTAVFAATRLLSVALRVDKGAAMDRTVHDVILHPRYKRMCKPMCPSDRRTSDNIVEEVSNLFKGAQA